MHRGGIAEIKDLLDLCFLLHPSVVPVFLGEAEVIRLFCEACVGIILTKENAVLCAGSEHSVRFIHSFRTKIIDKYADISFISLEYERIAAAHSECGVNTSHETLACCLLIACSSVDLPSEEEAGNHFRLQGMVELRRVEVIVFDGVSGAVGFDISQCRYLMDSLELCFHRHR